MGGGVVSGRGGGRDGVPGEVVVVKRLPDDKILIEMRQTMNATEIALALGYSVNGIYTHLRRLELISRRNYTKEIFEYIRRFWSTNGCSPTSAEISKEFGISKTAIYRHLDILEARGLIETRRGPAGNRVDKTYRPYFGQL